MARLKCFLSFWSTGKALRICFTYTKQAGEDAAVFAKVPSIIADNEDLVESSQEIDDVHDKYLQSLVETYSLGSKDKASRVILDYVMTSGNEATIFEVKRCKHGDVCKNCWDLMWTVNWSAGCGADELEVVWVKVVPS